jgi:DNA modification methylase
MKTRHQIFFENSKDMRTIPSQSIDLVVTSPPYPMIKMWDEMFAGQNRRIRDALAEDKNLLAYDLMHRELGHVWNEVYRVLKNGAIACINIGDAVRTIGNDFMLYANHSRILTYLLDIGFAALPLILWRKQTNAPNKFMGSGMLPAGAYVTLEHEYILILRKGSKREFESTAEKKLRRESAIFWEERNSWYSDVWLDLKGITQKLQSDNSRLRSAAFPFEIPYRLINMFSVKADTVLDPFLGTGTTMRAAMTAGRNSIGFEMEDSFRKTIFADRDDMVQFSNQIISDRIDRHMDFVRNRYKTKGEFKYINKHYNFPVVTQQEKELLLNPVAKIVKNRDNQIYEVEYDSTPHIRFDDNMKDYIAEQQHDVKRRKRKRQIQLKWHE